LVSIARVRVPRRWGVVHIAADPPVDPPEPDAARLRGPALALRRRFGRRDAGSRGEDPDRAEDHDQRADRSAVHPTIVSPCSQLVQIYPIRQTRGRGAPDPTRPAEARLRAWGEARLVLSFQVNDATPLCLFVWPSLTLKQARLSPFWSAKFPLSRLSMTIPLPARVQSSRVGHPPAACAVPASPSEMPEARPAATRPAPPPRCWLRHACASFAPSCAARPPPR
jgi:hypothetical protein